MSRDDLGSVVDQAEAALDEGDAARAEKLVRRALGDHPHSADLLGLLGEALETMGDIAGARDAYVHALENDPDWAAGHAHVAGLELELGRIGEATDRLDRAFDLDPVDPEANYNFAILLELQGETGKADRFYWAAADLDPDRYHVPTRVSMDEFETMALASLDDLPEEVRSYIADVPIVVEELPERSESGRYPNDAPLLLGECIGDHMGDGAAFDPLTGTVSSIVLYKRNLERVCSSRDELDEQVHVTVLHEILHWLGLDEDEVGDRGLG